MINSYDTWHGKNHLDLRQDCDPNMLWRIYVGTKNVAKGMKTIAQGAKKNEGKTWFSQLSDKSEFSILYLLECQM